MLTTYNIDQRLNLNEEAKAKLISNFAPIVISQFHEDSFKFFLEETNRLVSEGADIIPIVIDSFGGETYSVLGMIDIMQTLEKLGKIVLTSCICKAMSGGALLTAFGTSGYRFIAPNSSLMLHQLSACPNGKVAEIKQSCDEIDRMQKNLYERLDKKCGHKKQFFLNKLRKVDNGDLFLTATEAVNLGLCDKVGVPCLEFKVAITTDIGF